MAITIADITNITIELDMNPPVSGNTIRLRGANSLSRRWFYSNGQPGLDYDNDADLLAIRTAVQNGVIPESYIHWVIPSGGGPTGYRLNYENYPHRWREILKRLDPFQLPTSLSSTLSTRTSHWHKVGTGSPPTVTTPSLSTYGTQSIEAIMTAAGWTETIPAGEPLFLLEIIETGGAAYARGTRTSTRRYSVDGGATWTTTRPSDPSTITDIQEYLHGGWFTTGAPHSRHIRSWIGWHSSSENRRKLFELDVPADVIELWFYVQDTNGAWDTNVIHRAAWVKLPLTNLHMIKPGYVGPGVQWTDQGVYRIWGSLQAGSAAIGVTYEQDWIESGMWGIDLAFLTYPEVTLAAELSSFGNGIVLASGQSFYGFEVGDIALISTTADGTYDASTEKVRVTAHAGQSVTIERGVEGTTAVAHPVGAKVRGEIDPGKLWALQILRVQAVDTATLLEVYFRRQGER